jgi:hypothetical protein
VQAWSVFSAPAEVVDRLWLASRELFAELDLELSRLTLVCDVDRGPVSGRYVPFAFERVERDGLESPLDDPDGDLAAALAQRLGTWVLTVYGDDHTDCNVYLLGQPDGTLEALDLDGSWAEPTDDPSEHPDDPYYGLVDVGQSPAPDEPDEPDEPDDDHRMARTLRSWGGFGVTGPCPSGVRVPLAGDGRPSISAVHAVNRAVAAARRTSEGALVQAAIDAIDAAALAGDLADDEAEELRDWARTPYGTSWDEE